MITNDGINGDLERGEYLEEVLVLTFDHGPFFTHSKYEVTSIHDESRFYLRDGFHYLWKNSRGRGVLIHWPMITNHHKGKWFLLLRGEGSEEEGKKEEKTDFSYDFTREIHVHLISNLYLGVNLFG
jgi:hypothetical protein